MSRLLARLPKRFQWTVHNLIGHPAQEVLWQMGLVKLSAWAHDATVPFNVGPPREND
jgi:hypothetical protein